MPTITHHKCTLFADDISIVITSPGKFNDNTINNHEIDINNTIDIVIKWLDMNNLKINLSKTNYINFNNNRIRPLQIKHNGEQIDQLNETNFLGLKIDNQLNWKQHIESVSERLNKFAYAIKCLRHLTSSSTVLSAYHAFVGSIARYCLVMWGNGVDLKRAFIAQKKCVRAITGESSQTSCKPFFRDHGLLPLPALYIYVICIFVRQHPDLFVRAGDIRTRSCRNPDRLVFKQIPLSAKYSRNCLCMCVRIYNHIPDEFKTLAIKEFKTKLYKWLNEKTYYSVKEFLAVKQTTG